MANAVFAVFLDRDGTLNDDPGYINHPDQLKLLPGVGEALASLAQAGYRLVVVSNQSGVGRGLIKPEAIPLINERLQSLLKPFGVRIDHFELCFHHPDDKCACRKPSPQMIQNGARHLGVQLSGSVMVGDRRSDLEAGRSAGCGSVILVRTGDGEKTSGEISGADADFVAKDLAEAARWILR
ncbi:MAG: D-glycero-beta-D-manno-heptose 1,7-bisphosphate 7-phosphatase [Bacteriovoracia bacterium]